MSNKGIILIVVLIAAFGLIMCSRKDESATDDAKYQKNPVDEIIKEHNKDNNFSILLYDMDFDEAKDEYKHKYQVIIVEANGEASQLEENGEANEFEELDEEPITSSFITLAQNDTKEVIKHDTAYSKITDWKIVSPVFFNANIDNMGMELASKVNGKLSKSVVPPGYSNYIGNEKYGQWQKDNSGNNFWSFYGRYAFMSSMFYMAMMPVRYSMWNNYHTNYRGTNRPYYGNHGNGKMYGTGSHYNSSAMKNTSYHQKPASFKQNVRSRVARSASTYGKPNSKVKRTTGRSTRSVRSRSVGTGK